MSEELLLDEWEWQARREALSRGLDDAMLGRKTQRWYVNDWEPGRTTELGPLTYEETRRSYNHTIDLADENASMYGRMALDAIRHEDDGRAELWANMAASEAHMADRYEGYLRELEEKRGKSD